MQHIVVDQLRLEYRDIAAARAGRPTLVLLHEGLGCVALWRDFPDRLAEATGCRVIAGSRAGYGGSQPYAEARQTDYMHREARHALPALLAALDIERPLLVGHSDGASIGLIHAGSFPHQPLGLVVMAPHEFVEEATLAGLRQARDTWANTDWCIRLGRFHADPERVFHEWNDTWLSPEFRDWNIEDMLPHIACPVLAIQGEDDEYATLRQIDVIAAAHPDTQRLALPHCGHAPHKERPTEVIAAIATFIERCCGAA